MFEQYNDLVTVEELCEMLFIGKNAAYKLLASGELKCFRSNRIWKIPKQGVIEYIKTQSNLA
ncbi:DNA binding domain-containing protein, excisionase family [Propionispira arboris]|uniref:DNA binding domain-containing protein, excisionase family n=1 Tax=Propionispira arboris TaxID=84035 RepID=A0A1H6ZLC4_9FIRM|nr:helix-turn-helix domain-containing protein [Propionispira arboris]SEJ54201.1 DNA binding domain-containing protein, excisionase family [Propionispira arboris]